MVSESVSSLAMNLLLLLPSGLEAMSRAFILEFHVAALEWTFVSSNGRIRQL